MKSLLLLLCVYAAGGSEINASFASAGITRICFGEFYRDNRIFEVASKIGIELVHTGLPGVNLAALPIPPKD